MIEYVDLVVNIPKKTSSSQHLKYKIFLNIANVYLHSRLLKMKHSYCRAKKSTYFFCCTNWWQEKLIHKYRIINPKTLVSPLTVSLVSGPLFTMVTALTFFWIENKSYLCYFCIWLKILEKGIFFQGRL